MARWEPDARGRLERAAFSLYTERGFENTTVAEIAERAGLTERTFFRHFADKREVLFSGSDQLQKALVGAVIGAPDSAAPIDAAAAGVEAAAQLIPGRERARARQAIIATRPELQERELIKMASLSAALADALRRRGVPEPGASLTAEVAVGVFKVAFVRWAEEPADGGLVQLIRELLEQTKSLAAGQPALSA